MRSDEPKWWDERFRREQAIWGEGPSPTAMVALPYLPADGRVLEVGFGYGRDLAFLLRHGYLVSGIDLSVEARRLTEERLRREGLRAERLEIGAFEDSAWPDGLFDAVLSHRAAHLLVTDQVVERFAAKVQQVLRPGGILCLAVRNTEDMNPAEVSRIYENVCEYTPRPGHWIRFWDDDALQKTFGKAFTFLTLVRVCEIESRTRPVPCSLTILVGRKCAPLRAESPALA